MRKTLDIVPIFLYNRRVANDNDSHSRLRRSMPLSI